MLFRSGLDAVRGRRSTSSWDFEYLSYPPSGTLEDEGDGEASAAAVTDTTAVTVESDTTAASAETDFTAVAVKADPMWESKGKGKDPIPDKVETASDQLAAVRKDSTYESKGKGKASVGA